MIIVVALAIGCYLLGSIPFGVVVGKMRGVDIRDAGSGNIGATNAARVLGKGAGALVLLGDALKVYVPLYYCQQYFLTTDVPRSFTLDHTARMCCVAGIALAGFCGHLYSPWLRFRGGKGVASGLGVYLALMPLCAIVAALTWMLAYSVSRLSSVASLAAVWVGVLTTFALEAATPMRALAIAIALLVTERHRENIARLRKGTELKV